MTGRWFADARELSGPLERVAFDMERVDCRLLGRYATERNVGRATWWEDGPWGVVLLEWERPATAADQREFRTAIGPALRRRVMELVEASVPIPRLRVESPTRWVLVWPPDGPERSA